MNEPKIWEDKKDKLLFYTERREEKFQTSNTEICFLKSGGIHIMGDGYANGSEIVVYSINKEQLNKLIKLLEKEHPNLNSEIDIERCKNRTGEENWNKLDEREQRIFSVLEAVFSVFDAYDEILKYIRKNGIEYYGYGADAL